MVKKIMTTLLFLILAMQIGKAQYAKVSLGVKGIGIATIMSTTPESDGMSFGGGGGAFVGVKLGKFIGFQGEFLYAMQGAKYKLQSVTGQDISVKLTQNYMHFPIVFQLCLGKVFCLDLGIQPSLVSKATYKEVGETTITKDDTGALDYCSLLGGITLNFGRVVFFNARYTYSIGDAYMLHGKGSKISTIQAGLGFRIYTTKRSTFK
ncbi:MAG: outer membrane beta-barrel protein [Bacteroidales bacterium]